MFAGPALSLKVFVGVAFSSFEVVCWADPFLSFAAVRWAGQFLSFEVVCWARLFLKLFAGHAYF